MLVVRVVEAEAVSPVEAESWQVGTCSAAGLVLDKAVVAE